MANWNPSPDKVWLNNGKGTFTDSGQLIGNSFSSAVSLGDLDGDGDLDAFVSTSSSGSSISLGPNKIWLNNGSGIFTDTGQALGNSEIRRGVSLGDLDGDGYLDAVVANLQGDNDIWLNDGKGTFTDSGQAIGRVSIDISL